MHFRKYVSLIAFIVFTLVSTHHARAHHPTVEPGTGRAGPIRTTPATPMPQGKWSFSFQFETLAFDSFSDEELKRFARTGDDVHSTDSVLHAILGMSYGVTEAFTLSLSIPYAYLDNVREAHADEPDEVHKHGDAKGISDLSLIGQYRFLETGPFESSFLLGMKFPTGRTHDKDIEGERFETEFQPGSGSWDPLAGVAVGARLGKIGTSLSLLYILATEGAQNTDLGDKLSYNAALFYRAIENKVNWDLILELNGEWKQKEEIAGEKDKNSGGNIVLVSPGMRVSWNRNWSVFISAGFPVIQDMNGVQSDLDFRTLTGISLGF